MIVRISKGRFDIAAADAVADRLRDSEMTLRPAVESLSGCRAFLVGIDPRLGYMTNTSLWDSYDQAEQMSRLPEMLALRADFDALGIAFDPITNHDLLWQTGQDQSTT